MTRRFLAFLCVGMATAGVARERGQSTGSAIAPRVTIQDAAGAITACFTNGQPRSSQPLQPGDALELHFTAGTVNACSMLPSEDGFAVAGEWSCAVDGPIVRLTYSGPPRDWPATGLACATIDWTRPARPSAVLVEARPLRNGAMAPAEPASVPMVGAPSGGAGSGRAVQAFSTEAAFANHGDDVVLIPGLDIAIDVREQAELLVHFNGFSSQACGGQPANAVILIDGLPMAARRLENVDTVASLSASKDNHWTWLSAPLAAGRHQVALGIAVDDTGVPGGSSPCLGHSDPEIGSHLIVLEVPAAD